MKKFILVGYFPCRADGSIVRLFNLPMIRRKLPESLAEWNYNELCCYCCHAFAVMPLPIQS